MSMRTPLARVRGLGSARAGEDHFWKQRVTAVANVILVCISIALLVSLLGSDYATVKKALAKPAITILLLLLVMSGVYHMRLGMQSIIEDYVQSDGRKIALLVLNTFFAISIALTCIFATLKLSLGS
jgi:succinate dehydrogenase / fumarate reductase, membrane anchor subunit